MKLEKNRTNIYIDGKLFNSCFYLLLNFPIKTITSLKDIESVDEARDRLDAPFEYHGYKDLVLDPEIEFWGHCSNFQV